MNKKIIRLKTLTPVWTGGSTGTSKDFKPSGVIGGFRQAFEMLVRKHGGHTCNITGEDRCNYEKDRQICPACAVFGCTGLSRAFKLDLLSNLMACPPYPPDLDPRIPNRTHDNTGYGSCSIVTWMAGCTGFRVNGHFPRPDEKDPARSWLRSNVSVYYSPEVIDVNFIPLRRSSHGEDLLHLLILHTLSFMSRYSGLGAKVRQGWGIFDLCNQDEISLCSVSEEECFRELIDKLDFAHIEWDDGLPNADHCFIKEWMLTGEDLGFDWGGNSDHPVRNCRQVGFAMNYRLRRHIKFFELEHSDRKLPISNDWRNIEHRMPKWENAPWKESIAFVRALFGRDNSDEKHKIAGLVGTSHMYRRNAEDKWRIRFFGRIPDVVDYPGVGHLSWKPESVRSFLTEEMENLLNTRM